MDVNDGLARLKRHIGQLSAIGRPSWRDDGIQAGQSGLRVFAISVSNPQVKTGSRLGDIRNPGRKNALFAREFFINKIRDTVGRQTQVPLRHQIALPAQILTAYNIPKAKTNIKSTISETRYAASDERISALLPPHCDIRPSHFIKGSARRIDSTKLSAALEIRLDDGTNFLWRSIVPLEIGDRDGKLC